MSELNNGFILMYEANGAFYSKLSDIDKVDGRLVHIHPVYYTDYSGSLISEDITWSGKSNKYRSKSKDGSWLDAIKKYPDYIFQADPDNTIKYDDIFFHCSDCLSNYLSKNGNLESIKFKKSRKR